MEMLKIKKVGFAYSRLSQRDRHKLSKEEKETSLINARNDIIKYCDSEDVELINFFEEKYKSGAKWDRVEVKDAIDSAKKYALEHREEIKQKKLIVQFIFKNLSRLARDSVFQESNLRDMEDPPYYIEIVSIEEGEVIKNKAIRGVIGSMNEYKITEGRRSTKKRHAESLEKGIPPIPAPFGYYNDRNLHQWVIQKDKAKIAISFWELYASGMTSSQIISTIRISVGLYYRMLKNFENYLGKIIYRKNEKNSKGKIVDTERLVFDGKHKPILTDLELIEKIKLRLNGS